MRSYLYTRLVMRFGKNNKLGFGYNGFCFLLTGCSQTQQQPLGLRGLLQRGGASAPHSGEAERDHGYSNTWQAIVYNLSLRYPQQRNMLEFLHLRWIALLAIVPLACIYAVRQIKQHRIIIALGGYASKVPQLPGGKRVARTAKPISNVQAKGTPISDISNPPYRSRHRAQLHPPRRSP